MSSSYEGYEVGDTISVDLGGIGPARLIIREVGEEVVQLQYETGKKIEMDRSWFDREIEIDRKYGNV